MQTERAARQMLKQEEKVNFDSRNVFFFLIVHRLCIGKYLEKRTIASILIILIFFLFIIYTFLRPGNSKYATRWNINAQRVRSNAQNGHGSDG